MGSARKILVAVDFGTTFSGVAWAQTARPDVQTTIIQWPSGSDDLEGVTNEKVPTELCYDGGECKWGFEVPDGQQRYQWFKLELDPEKSKENSFLSVEYPDPNALPTSCTKSAEVLSTQYLAKLRKHVVEVLKTKLGAGVVESTAIEYVITVPAIWSDAAKYRTRACAKRAGMGGDLQIISEPEAAVICVLDSQDPGTLEVGDKFVMCDAGGGTVDLISYMVEELEPALRICEVAPGGGAACGSTFLNRIFRKYLEDNFADHDGWDEDTLETALERFETVVKRKFNGEQKETLIPVPGLVNDRTKGVVRGKLTLSSAALRAIFEPVIAAITALISAQIKITVGHVKAVLLVGGFGQSPYLRRCIQKVVGDVQVIQPPMGWTAVVRGALIKGLAKVSPAASGIQIGHRIARKAYGCQLATPLVQGEHDEGRRYWDGFRGTYFIHVMRWLVKKGDTIKEADLITYPCASRQLVSRGPLSSMAVELYSFEQAFESDPPLYADQGPKLLLTLTADLSSIPTDQMSTGAGRDGEMYYICSFEIRIKFHSAHTTYSLWYEGKCYGAAEAEYA